MNRKKITPSYLLMGRGFTRIIPPFVFAIFYLCGSILAAPTTYAAGVPGGNITNPVVRAVDIAKPAVVRIAAKITGRLTVDFPTNTGGTVSVTFPQTGAPYSAQYTGSGAFISAHGDILTADHLVHPTPDLLYDAAAVDIANFFNSNSHSSQTITPNDVLAQLTSGFWPSKAQYSTPSMRVFYSTDFTGPTDATSLDAMPSDTFADVGSGGILKTADFDHGDTAIIHISREDTPSIKLGDSSNVEPQDQLTIIGFPGNGDLPGHDNQANKPDPSTGFLTESVNQIYVSALKQSRGNASLIQVGGNVEHGDSGGPALDSNGNIVGVVSFGGTDTPDGTSFLQASSSAQKLVDALQLDTTPGPFQTAWNEALNQYGSTQAGHWHTAQQDLQSLQSKYPTFHAVDPFLAYATAQASKETTTITSTNIIIVVVGLIVLILIFVLVMLLFFARQKRNRQAALATQAASYQPPYNGPGGGSESPELASAGSMAQVDLKDEADLRAAAMQDPQLAQPLPMHSAPQVPQTPAASYNAARSSSLAGVPDQPAMSSWPPQVPQTPAASYNAAQPASYPVAQPPMSPWPQPYGTPAYGQSVPYGQQPYNTGQPARPAQGGAYQPYPAQQQPYAPYPQAPVPPWPPTSGNMPYAAQQDAATQRRQPPATPAAAYGQLPQGYGAMATPAQPQQLPAHLIPDASLTPEEQTVRAGQRNASTPEEIAKLAEEKKKNTASSMSELAADQTDMATITSEQEFLKRLSEE